jgi:predicted DCC family thiol-disulfide oxidoreductase YuxK
MKKKSESTPMSGSASESEGSTRSLLENAMPPVLFFDGECGLCNHSVRWLLDHDRRRVLSFAPLQGELATHRLAPLASNYRDWSVALWDQAGVHFESDAALRAIACLGGRWRLARLFLLVPRVIRNGIYRFIARNRIRWFGRVDSCALLSAEDRARLLP